MRSSAMGQEVTLTIDSSAVVAIILREPTEEALVTKILSAGGGHIAAPNFLEVYMVLRPRLGEKTGSILESKMDELEIIVVPFTPEHAQAATRAFDRYGKGRHSASLNFEKSSPTPSRGPRTNRSSS